MIHFDFIVSDADAENILGCILSSALKSSELVIHEMCKDNPSDDMIRGYKQNHDYLISLIPRMTNTRISNENS